MSFELPELPYEKTALEPYISANTINYHYGKHHQAYVNNLNGLLDGHGLAKSSLEDIILVTAHDPENAGIFNNAAQVWNHTFFWNSMKKSGGGKPSGKVAEMIDTSFGGYENFAKEFKTAAATQFGSGWAWLVEEKGKLKIIKTANANSAIAMHVKPIICIDVWEHAYYLDYQNKRPDFIDTFLNNLVNWDFANQNLG